MKHLAQWFREKLSLMIPFSVGGGVMAFTFLTFFDYFEPYLYPLHMIQGEARPVTQQSIVGPYPAEADLVRLQTKLGVTHIVSLLDDRHLPQEKALLMKEEKLCEKHRLHLLKYPLSYLSPDEPENMETIRSLMVYIKAHPQEKFYIHCYLGKHRAGRVETLLKAEEEAKRH